MNSKSSFAILQEDGATASASDMKRPYTVKIDGVLLTGRTNRPRRFSTWPKAWAAASQECKRREAQAKAPNLRAVAEDIGLNTEPSAELRALPDPITVSRQAMADYEATGGVIAQVEAETGRKHGLKIGETALSVGEAKALVAAKLAEHPDAVPFFASLFHFAETIVGRDMMQQLLNAGALAEIWQAHQEQRQTEQTTDAEKTLAEQAADLRRQAGEYRTGAGYADDPAAFRRDMEEANKLEGRAEALEKRIAELESLAAKTVTPPQEMTFAAAKALVSDKLREHGGLRSLEEFESHVRELVSNKTANLLKFTGTLKEIWEAHQESQKPETSGVAQAAPAQVEETQTQNELAAALSIIQGGKPESTKQPATQRKAKEALEYLRGFMGPAQLSVLTQAMRGEEKQFFRDKVVALADAIRAMPEVYGQDGQGDQAVVHLHYFYGNQDWYITEKDSEPEQLQAFGLAVLGHDGELGYISLLELAAAGVELDLYWTPKTLAEIKGNPEVPPPADDGNDAPWLVADLEAEAGDREATPKVIASDSALVAVYNGSDMTEAEFSALADSLPETATVQEVIEAAQAMRADPETIVDERPADPASRGTDAYQAGYEDGFSGHEPDTIPSMPIYSECYMEGWTDGAKARANTQTSVAEEFNPTDPIDPVAALTERVGVLEAQLDAALSRIEELAAALASRNQADSLVPSAPRTEQPVKKPTQPRQTASGDIAINPDSAPYKRGYKAGQEGGKADTDWHQGYREGQADRANNAPSREKAMAGRSLSSGYRAGFNATNPKNDENWAAGFEAGRAARQ